MKQRIIKMEKDLVELKLLAKKWDKHFEDLQPKPVPAEKPFFAEGTNPLADWGAMPED